MEIYSSEGILQADCNLVGFFCRKSVVTTTQTTYSGWTSPSSLIVPISGQGYTYPIIAISCSSYVAKSGITTSGDFVFNCSGSVGTSITYYVFDWAPAIPASTFGIELYNESGQRTFSSNYFPMQGLSIITDSSYTASGKTLAAGLPAMGSYSIAGPIDYYSGGFQIIPENPGDYDSTGYQNDSDLYGARVINSGQTVEYGSVSFDDIYIGPTFGDVFVLPDWDRRCSVIPIDVTNIPLNTTFF